MKSKFSFFVFMFAIYNLAFANQEVVNLKCYYGDPVQEFDRNNIPSAATYHVMVQDQIEYTVYTSQKRIYHFSIKDLSTSNAATQLIGTAHEHFFASGMLFSVSGKNHSMLCKTLLPNG